MMSQPRALRSLATSTASADSIPPGAQSTAEMRTEIGLWAGMAELEPDPGATVRVHEVDDPFPGRDVLRLVHAGAARRDAAFPADVGHLREHEARASDGASAEMHQVPVVGRAVVGRVLAHR